MLVAFLLLAGAVAAVPPVPAMEELPPSYGTDTLVVLPSAAVPTLDGVVDTLWSSTNELEVPAAGASGAFPPGSGITVRALHNFTHVFLLIAWPDSTPDMARDAWQLTDNSTPQGSWARTGWGHDSLSIFLDNGTGAEQNFSVLGCTATCHSGTGEMHTTGPGIVDLWHWTASRSAPLGIADDRYLDNQSKAGGSATGGFHPDDADPWSDNNVTTAFGPRPGFLNGSSPTSATFIMDADKQAINWTTFDSGTMPNGTLVPGAVLEVPGGSEGDVASGALHAGSSWVLELARPFVTQDAAGHDVPIVDLDHLYYFSLAVTDNKTGFEHSVPLAVNKLVFAENNQPDYLVRNAVVTPPDVTVGEIANFTVRVRNNGFANATAPSAVALVDLSNATEVARTTLPAVAWASERVVYINLATAAYTEGVHNFSIVADNDNEVSESNETNNAFVLSVNVIAAPVYPDLVLTNVTSTPALALVPENITISGAVSNIGTGASGGDVLVRATNVSFAAATANVGPLAPGGSANFTINLSTASVAGGSYAVSVEADPDSTIFEGSTEAETNNSAIVFVAVESRPNLVASAVTLFPAAALAGDVIEINVTVTNLGAQAVGPVVLWTYLDNATSSSSADRVLTWTAQLNMGPGTFTHIPMPWQVPLGLSVGTHSVRVWVDATGAFGELDEGDNNRSTALIVLELPRPDLTVSGASMSSATYSVGELAVVTVQVTNTGANYTGAATVEVRDALSNTTLGSASFNPVAAGVTQGVEVSFTVPPGLTGPHLLSVDVDSTDAIAEASELNNSRTVGYELLAPLIADLTVGAISAFPAAPFSGDLVQLRIDVYNNGTDTSPATAGAFRLGAALIGYIGIPALAAGSGTTLTLEWDSTAFTGLNALISFQADVNGTVTEASEGNNSASFSLLFTRPGAPSIRLGTLSRAPPAAAVGEAVRLEISARNNGTAPGAARLRLLVDGVIVLDEAFSLDPNQSTTRSANWSANTSGTYVVRAELLVGGSVVDATTSTVTITQPPGDGVQSDASWIWVVVALVVAGAVGLFLVGRRRPPSAPTKGEPEAPIATSKYVEKK